MDPRPDTPSDRTDDSDSPDAGPERHTVSAAERIIDLFGGIRPMAHKLNVPVTTVQGWKKRGAIPESRHDEILQAAEQHDLMIDPADLAAAAPRTPGAEDLPEGTGEEAAGIQDARRGPEPEAAAAEAREEPGPTPAEPEEAEVPEKAEEPEKAEVKEPGVHEPPDRSEAEERPETAQEPAPETAEPHTEPEQPPAALIGPVPRRASDAGPAREPERPEDAEAGRPEEAERERERQPWVTPAPAAAAAPNAEAEREHEREPDTREREPERRAPTGGGAAAPPRRSAATGWAWVAAIIAIIGAIGAITAPAWAPQVLPQVVPEDMLPAAMRGPSAADLANRLDTLEQRVQALPEAGRVTELGQRLDQVATQVEQIPEQPAAGPALDQVQQRVASLEQQLGQIEQAVQAGGGDTAAVASLVDQIDQLAQRINELEGALGETAGGEQLQNRLAELNQQVTQLAGTVQALQAEQTASSVLRQSVNDLADRVERLSQDIQSAQERTAQLGDQVRQVQAADTRTQALVLAISQLRAALDNGTPFSTSLAAVQSLVRDAPELTSEVEPLEPYADTGVPSFAALLTRFPEMAREVRTAAATADDADWLDQVGDTVAGLVTVRRAAGEIEGEDIGAVLARAEARLNAENLAGAVASLEELDGPAAEAAESWLSDARARIAAEDAVQALTANAIERLTGPSGTEQAAEPANP